MKTFLILLVIFSSAESNPHLTNVFMNMAKWNYQNGFENNQLTDTIPIESSARFMFKIVQRMVSIFS